MLVFLIGFMGSGKSTVGKKLAKKLSFDFLDLDELIEKDEACSIDQLFTKFGEEHFRKIEHRLLTAQFNKKKLVLACGGGTPCFYNSINLMNEVGCTVYLQMNQDALFSRLINAKSSRPLLKNRTEPELRNYIQLKLAEREKIYLESGLIINGIGVNVNTLAQQIIEKFGDR